MTKTDRIIGIVIMLLSIGMLYMAITLEHPVFDRDPGPSFIPIIYAVALLICTLGLILLPRKKHQQDQQDKEDTDAGQFRNNTIRMLVLFGSLLVYVAVFKVLGFIVSTIVFLMFAFYYLAKERNLKLIVTSLIISVITTGLVYYVMKVQLSIQLPKGVFF